MKWFLAIGTMKGLHWKLKEIFFSILFSKVPNLPFLPQWLQSLAPGTSQTSEWQHASHGCSCCKTNILLRGIPVNPDLFPIQVCSAMPLFPLMDTRLLCSAKHKSLDMAVKWQSTCFIATYSTYTSKNPHKSEFKGLSIVFVGSLKFLPDVVATSPVVLHAAML